MYPVCVCARASVRVTVMCVHLSVTCACMRVSVCVSVCEWCDVKLGGVM